MSISGVEDVNLEEVVHDGKWKKAMDEVISSFEKSATWELTDLRAGTQQIGVKFVYKKKISAEGEVERYKA